MIVGMKASSPIGTSRAVAARAVHGKNSFAKKGAAIVLGTALQIAVMNGVAHAGGRLVDGPQTVSVDPAAKIEDALGDSKKALDKGASKVDSAVDNTPDVGQAASDAKDKVSTD